MDNVPRWSLRFKNFEKAFQKLSMIVNKNNLDDLEKMALIQAFEFTFELGWKTLKDYLNESGFNVKSPKETIRQAYQSNYIQDGQTWMDAIDKRNESTHAYDETILGNITDFIFNNFFDTAKTFYEDFKLKMAEK